MLRSLFKKKNKSVTDAERIQRIEAQNKGKEARQQAFYRLALANESDSLRRLAIEKIEVTTLLQPLKEQIGDPELRTLVERRLNAQQQNDQSQLSVHELTNDSKLDVGTGIEAVLRCNQVEQAKELFKELNQDQFFTIVQQHKNLDIRRTALNQIHEEKLLQLLIKSFKGKNKSLFRTAKDALTAVREKVQAAEKWQADYLSVQEKLKQIPSLGISPQLPLTLQALEIKWESLLDNASEEQKKNIEVLLNTAQDYIAAHQSELEDILTEAKAQSEFDAVVNELTNFHQAAQEALTSEEPLETSIARLRQGIGEAVKRWERALRFAETTADQSSQYQKLMSQLESLHLAQIALSQASDDLTRLRSLAEDELNGLELKRMGVLLKQINWPLDFPKPKLLVDLEAIQGATKEKLNAAREKEAADLKEVLKLKAIIDSQLRRGVLRPADRLFEKMQAKLAELPTHKQERLEKSITKLQEEIQNLKDWKGFVTEPKKDQLLEAMAELVDFKGHVEERAERVKALQAQWKELKYDNSSEDDAVSRFKELADKAYAPCAEYFEEKSKIRAANLAAKEKICQDLTQFCSSVKPKALGWEKISEIKKQAKQDWKKIGPVDNVKIKVINKRFSQALDALDQVFEQALTDILEEKSRLIEQAKQLLVLENNAEAIDKAKRLQSLWSEQEKLPYSRERDLWKSFRACLDEIFAKRAQLRSEQKEAEKQIDTAASTIISAIEKLAEEPDLLEKLGELDALKQDFDNLDFDNSGQKTRLNKRLAKAVTLVRNHQSKLQDQKRAKRMEEFKQKLASLKEADSALLDSAQMSDEEGIASESECGNNLPAVYQECLQQRVTASKAFRGADSEGRKTFMSDNQKAKEAICLDLEILKGVETPAPWKDQRMERQVALLSSAMMSDHQDLAAKKKKIKDLTLQYYALGLATSEASLDERFELAVKVE